MDTKKLRQKILDLAIRGKLVPQDPNDEPASVLLERIREEKKQMVKDGKLKAKDIKNDTIIFKGEDNLHYEKFQDGTVKCIEDEIPFEVPEGWAWCRLQDLFFVCSAKRVLQADWKDEGIPFYRAREIVKLSENGYVDNELYISKEHYLTLKKSFGVPSAGDIMLSAVGTIGKPYIVKKGDLFYYKDASVICLKRNSELINSEYTKLVLESPYMQKIMYANSNGTTVDTITISTANQYLYALPPLSEQVRITKEAEIVLKLNSSIEEDKKDLNEIISISKSKILDLAIRGKLVPQNPEDEPASVLLERIREEKEELIKQGKIKKDKKESIIYKGDDNSYYEKLSDGTAKNIDNELPFDLPTTWQWVRLKDIFELLSGRDLRTSEYNDTGNGIPYITGASNFDSDKVIINRWTCNPQVVTHIGDLLITCKGTVGETAINTIGDSHIARQIMAIRNTFSLNIDFSKICIDYYVELLKNKSKGLIPGISRDDILYLLFPLPPENEQNKIVKALSSYNEMLRNIEINLN